MTSLTQNGPAGGKVCVCVRARRFFLVTPVSRDAINPNFRMQFVTEKFNCKTEFVGGMKNEYPLR